MIELMDAEADRLKSLNMQVNSPRAGPSIVIKLATI